ncbi:hypothetical protein D3C73_1595630 [compost metagenome]
MRQLPAEQPSRHDADGLASRRQHFVGYPAHQPYARSPIHQIHSMLDESVPQTVRRLLVLGMIAGIRSGKYANTFDLVHIQPP